MGASGAATCVSCHGNAHEIVPVADERQGEHATGVKVTGPVELLVEARVGIAVENVDRPVRPGTAADDAAAGRNSHRREIR